MLILHPFWLSLATYRVRIALNLKEISFEERAHDLSVGVQLRIRACNVGRLIKNLIKKVSGTPSACDKPPHLTDITIKDWTGCWRFGDYGR